ncbi:hypothetical protein RB653_010273 [Dictyostelium firmibasis]|uniref:Uncharacterized protein n=1 Tax=Dictyostelium firmibasis TaxID=79012 RepID=A0AAN7TTR7_9MYCE
MSTIINKQISTEISNCYLEQQQNKQVSSEISNCYLKEQQQQQKKKDLNVKKGSELKFSKEKSNEISNCYLKQQKQQKETKKQIVRSLPNNLPPLKSITQLGSWVFLQNRQLDSNGDALVCGVSGRYTQPGTQCILWQLNQNDPSQLWQQSKDGHLVSNLAGNYVMDFNNDGTNTVIASGWDNYLTQVWTYNSGTGQIANSNYPNMYLGIKGAFNDPIIPSNGTELVIDQPTSNDNLCFQWDMVPAYPLNTILTSPPQPFPSFPADQNTAFIQISQSLAGCDDIRSEYTNLAISLPFYQSQMMAMDYPSYLSHADFDFVRGQLSTEFEYAQEIINLFTNYGQFHTELFADNSARLDQMASLCQLEIGSSMNATGCMISVFSGLLYTILEALPGIGPVLGNVIQTAISIGVSIADGYSTIQPDPFQVTLSQLWNTLSSNFEALLSNISCMETLLLQDWGMMTMAHNLIQTLSGPYSLAWQSSMNGDLINAAVPGYENSLLQILMPSKYQIYLYDQSNNGGMPLPAGIPSLSQWSDPNNSNLTYFIGDNQTTTEYPDDSLMSLIWGNGVSKQDFFLSGNGWNFPMSLLNNNCSMGCPTVSNNTSMALRFKIQFSSTQIYNYEVPTFSSNFTTEFDGTAFENSYYQITVSDYAYNWVASISVRVDIFVLRGADISVLSSSCADGYYLGTPNCLQGSFAHGFSASINIPIFENQSS